MRPASSKKRIYEVTRCLSFLEPKWRDNTSELTHPFRTALDLREELNKDEKEKSHFLLFPDFLERT